METKKDTDIMVIVAELLGEALANPHVIKETGFVNLFDSLFRIDTESARTVLEEMQATDLDIKPLVYPSDVLSFAEDTNDYSPEEVAYSVILKLKNNPDYKDSLEGRKFLSNLDLLTPHYKDVLSYIKQLTSKSEINN